MAGNDDVPAERPDIVLRRVDHVTRRDTDRQRRTLRGPSHAGFGLVQIEVLAGRRADGDFVRRHLGELADLRGGHAPRPRRAHRARAATLDGLVNFPQAGLRLGRSCRKADFLDADRWQALCLSEPDRALRGLDAVASAGTWPESLWRQVIWSRTPYANRDTEARIAELLLQCPITTFAKLADAISAWLDEHARTLADDLVWKLWDRTAPVVLSEDGEEDDE